MAPYIDFIIQFYHEIFVCSLYNYLMFNLKYNFLVIIQIIVGILNSVLVMKVFGVSIYSDAYLLAISIFSVFCLILLMPIDQFMQFYNELKVKSLKKSHDFYNCALIFSLFAGILFCLFIHCGLDYIIKLFTLNLDIQRFEILKNLLTILTCGLMFYPINGVNERLLNAEMRFSIPYMLVIIPNLLVVLVQILMIFYHYTNIYYLAYAQALGLFLVSLFGSIYISKTLIRFKFVGWQDYMTRFIKNSMIMQFGNSFWSITIPIIFNNFLVTFPQGYVSYFYYARKILDIANNFSIGPSKNILRSKISKFVSKCDVDSIKKVSKSFLSWGGLVFLVTVVIAYFVQGPIISLISGNKLTKFDLKMISLLFLSLSPWYFIIFLETPYVCVNIQSKKAKTVLFINLSFLIIFAFLLPLFRNSLGIYSLAVSLILAQVTNLISHIHIANNIIDKMDK